jgi:hypothetical protein
LPFCAKLIIGLSGSAQSAYFLKCKSSRCACDPKLPAKSLFESAAKIGKKEKVKPCPPDRSRALFKKLSIISDQSMQPAPKQCFGGSDTKDVIIIF